MADSDQAAPDIDQRIEDVVSPEAELGPIADALSRRRGSILAGWLTAAREQPFHEANPDAAIADHIPVLLDTVIAVLQRSTRQNDVLPPMDDPAVIEAASAHARMRFEQGLGPVAVVTEFRLLRHEISRSLIGAVDDLAAADILAGQAVIDDALDGAATIGLSALSDRIETIREEFLATTVHDIRQPITLVTGSLDLAARWLADGEPTPGSLADAVDGAVVAVGEINTMLDTLSDASRVAMGVLTIDPEPARLDTIVSEAISVLDRDARARIRVEPRDGAGLIGVWDPHLLRRVVSNLVNNAIKYSPSELPIEIEYGRAGESTAQLEIRDHGMGLTTQEATEVFERFVRAERARAKGVPGLGLGLYACRGIIAAHGGTIVLHSDGPGTGTTVVVALPLLVEDGTDA